MKAFRSLALAVVAVGAVAGLARAGSTNRTGTSGAPELRIPVGARSVALSASDLAMVGGVEAIFYNPSGIVATDNKTEVAFSSTRYLADTRINYAAVAQSLGSFGFLGVSAKVLSIGDIIETTETAPDGTGATFSPTFSTVGLTYGKAMTDRVNFGGTVYYISERILQETSAGVAFDFGFQYETGVRGTRFGVALKDLGPNLQYSGSDFEQIVQLPGGNPQATGRSVATQSSAYELPTSLQMSVGVPLLKGVNAFTLFGTYSSNSYGRDEGRFGAEATLRKMLSLRGGYMYNGDSDALFQYTYGAGVRLPLGSSHLTVDWAAQPVHGGFFDDVQHISVAMTF
jgi:hypothetical protein